MYDAIVVNVQFPSLHALRLALRLYAYLDMASLGPSDDMSDVFKRYALYIPHSLRLT